MTPSTDTNKTLEVRKTVFDLDSKEDVTVVKVGSFTPVTTMEEFVGRLANNAAAILQIVNDGLEKYTETQIAGDTAIPWQLVENDDTTGAETLVPFTGTLLSADKSKQLGATVINIAKLMFNYAKQMVPGSVEENRKAKKAAKDSALEMILSNPAAVESLRK